MNRLDNSFYLRTIGALIWAVKAVKCIVLEIIEQNNDTYMLFILKPVRAF